MKLKRVTDKGEFYGWEFECPGCKDTHLVFTNETHARFTGPRWEFNGSLEKPTFNPSLHVTMGRTNPRICHSFIRNGQIQFLDDCTHAMRNQIVDLPEV